MSGAPDGPGSAAGGAGDGDGPADLLAAGLGRAVPRVAAGVPEPCATGPMRYAPRPTRTNTISPNVIRRWSGVISTRHPLRRTRSQNGTDRSASPALFRPGVPGPVSGPLTGCPSHCD